MNRIETKIVIMVTNRLAAAKDSEAKMELIEELSENLYQRYEDLTAAGVSEEEALEQVMDSLGDVKELLAYLKEEGAQKASEKCTQDAEAESVTKRMTGVSEKELEAQMMAEMEPQIEELEKRMEAEMKPQFEAMEKQIEAVMKGMMKPAKKEEFPAVVKSSGEFSSGEIRNLIVEVLNADVEVNRNEDDENPGLIDICSDSEDIEILEEGEDTLRIRQKRSEKGGFLQKIVLKPCYVEINIPEKQWDTVSIQSQSGDIYIGTELECQELKAASNSGDIEIQLAKCGTAKLSSVSGDVTAEILSDDLTAQTTSGDLEFSKAVCERIRLTSISGDVTANVSASEELRAETTSGDLELHLDIVPERARAATVSGDACIYVPKNAGFELRYQTLSGDFSTDLPFSGLKTGKKGKLTYQNGEAGELEMASVSGDLGIYGQ